MLVEEFMKQCNHQQQTQQQETVEQLLQLVFKNKISYVLSKLNVKVAMESEAMKIGSADSQQHVQQRSFVPFKLNNWPVSNNSKAENEQQEQHEQLTSVEASILSPSTIQQAIAGQLRPTQKKSVHISECKLFSVVGGPPCFSSRSSRRGKEQEQEINKRS